MEITLPPFPVPVLKLPHTLLLFAGAQQEDKSHIKITSYKTGLAQVKF